MTITLFLRSCGLLFASMLFFTTLAVAQTQTPPPTRALSAPAPGDTSVPRVILVVLENGYQKQAPYITSSSARAIMATLGITDEDVTSGTAHNGPILRQSETGAWYTASDMSNFMYITLKNASVSIEQAITAFRSSPDVFYTEWTPPVRNGGRSGR